MIRFAMVEILPAAVFLVPLYLLLYRLCFRNLSKTILCFLFAFYLCAVYALVGLPNVTYIRFDLSGNLIPFRDMLTGLRSSVENVLLFVPLGIFLPLLDRRYREVKRTVLSGFCLSLTMELLQIFTYRATDVNDLITNTLGTLLGYFLAKILIRKFPEWRWGGREIPVVFGSVFGVMFFLQPFAVALVWYFIS